MTLKIVHTHAEGTLIEGTSRGDGTAEVLKENGWRWGRSIASWYIPFSRDKLSNDWKIGATKKGLEAAGFEVEVTIDNETARTMEEREQHKAERSEARADMLAERAERHDKLSDAAHARARQIMDYIPMGQPVLIGHHSERGHRRDLARIDNGMRTSVNEHNLAQRAAQGAEIAANAQNVRYSPTQVANRIKKLEAEIRGVSRVLDGYQSGHGVYAMPHAPAEGEYRVRKETEKADLSAQLTYWQTFRDQQIESGRVVDYAVKGIKKGDFVKYWGGWREVVRVNKKSVSVKTGYTWTDTIEYAKIAGHKTAAEVEAVRAAKEASAEGQ